MRDGIEAPATAEGIGPAEQLLRPSADACCVYLYVMAVAEIFAFVLLYLIK